MENSFVLPGDYVGSNLEYLPGFGVYSKDDDLYSSSVGNTELDVKNHSAKVNVKTRIPKLQGIGTITYGVVADVSENAAMVDLVPIHSRNMVFVPRGVTAVLRVSNVRRGFVKDLHEEIKVGDVIKVRIIDVNKHTVTLTTDEKDLGVVKAKCSRCRTESIREGFRVKCPHCGFSETRKLSSEFGSERL